jgi:hypothetical protein
MPLRYGWLIALLLLGLHAQGQSQKQSSKANLQLKSGNAQITTLKTMNSSFDVSKPCAQFVEPVIKPIPLAKKELFTHAPLHREAIACPIPLASRPSAHPINR